MNAVITELREKLTNLSDNDRGFAVSLMASVEKQRRDPSEKQAYWLGELLKRAKGEQPQPATEAIGDLTGVMALFKRAAKHKPAVVLGYRVGADADAPVKQIRLNLAGPAARVPGSVNVIDEAERLWFGRILKDGTFEHSRRQAAPAEVGALLSRFAADPAKVASESGKLLGRCCFCNLKLTDERSREVGYGQVCASKHGLPWG